MGKQSKDEIMQTLNELGVAYNSEATYGTLALKLKAAQVSAEQEQMQGEPEANEEAPERLTPEKLEAPQAKVEAPVVETDYLRQYQYRKQTEFGSEGSDPVPGSKAEKMKKKLLMQPKVRFMIARKPNEDRSVKASVCLNGYRLDFPKQQMIDLPEQIVGILAESLQIEEYAKSVNLIDGDKQKESALL